MEASRGPREADVAPAPTPIERVTGWSPADPGPLGLGAFAGTTFILSMVNARLVGAGSTAAVFGVALVYGGIVQILAGMWEFRTGNTFGAVVFTSYGAFWISLYILFHTPASFLPVKAGPSAIGLFLWMWTIFTVLMLIASLRTAGVVAFVFVLLLITFIFLSIGNSGNSLSTIKIGGYFGLATAIVAWYGCLAGVANSTFGRTVFPVFPLGR
jgi:succinate-acetate transporter protein